MPSPPSPHPFDRLRARLLFPLILLISIAATLLLNATVGYSGVDVRVVGIVGALAVSAAAYAMARWAGLEWRRLFGPPLERESMGITLKAVPVLIAPILMLLSESFAFVVIPLSYVAPGFVEQLLTPPSFILADTVGELALLLVFAGVFAPLMEEVLFRGILLQRWGRRWGTLTGAIASSLLFAVLHQEWIARFAAGMLFAALYLRTRRLWVPIVAHSLTNLLIMAPYGAYRLWRPSPLERPTLAQLREGLPMAALASLAGIAIIALYVNLYWPRGGLRQALTGPLPYDENAAS